MLENWLSPVDMSAVAEGQLQAHHLGAHLRLHVTDSMPDLKSTKIALLGIGEKDANAVRRELYRMSFPFEGLKIADLGNIRKNNLSFIIPAVADLLESKILPVLIGNDAYFSLSSYKAIQQILQQINFVMVDERLRFDAGSDAEKANILNDILLKPNAQLFHLGVIGYQTHFTPPEVLRYFEEHNYDCQRLGYARANLTEMEPIVRDGDLLSFHLAALKQSEAPGQSNPTPSGFTVEEACQICRYAGMSDKLKAFGIFGFRTGLDRKSQTAQAVAQMLWYFLDGLYNRKGDFPASLDGLTEYIVEMKKLDYQLTFWKSQKTGRWWIQVPVKTRKKLQRHRLIPCSYNDYKLACQEELPDRLVQAFKRFM